MWYQKKIDMNSVSHTERCLVVSAPSFKKFSVRVTLLSHFVVNLLAIYVRFYFWISALLIGLFLH